MLFFAFRFRIGYVGRLDTAERGVKVDVAQVRIERVRVGAYELIELSVVVGGNVAFDERVGELFDLSSQRVVHERAFRAKTRRTHSSSERRTRATEL